jgi:hypothetical protein
VSSWGGLAFESQSLKSSVGIGNFVGAGLGVLGRSVRKVENLPLATLLFRRGQPKKETVTKFTREAGALAPNSLFLLLWLFASYSWPRVSSCPSEGRKLSTSSPNTVPYTGMVNKVCILLTGSYKVPLLKNR